LYASKPLAVSRRRKCYLSKVRGGKHPGALETHGFSLCYTKFHKKFDRHMLLSKEYVGYLARETVKRLSASEFIETKSLPSVREKVYAAMLDELSLEDRINDEVRVILETYSEEMRNTGANYQEMFRKVKNELVRKYRAVL
jgi:hypothetical protein